MKILKRFIKKLFQKFEEEKTYKIHQVIYSFQDYYLEKHKDPDLNKQYSEAIAAIEILGITQFFLKRNILTIVLRRPGILIGRHGENINALQKYLSENVKAVKNIKINIKEDGMIDWLTPAQPEYHDLN